MSETIPRIQSNYLPLAKSEISEKTDTTLDGILKGSGGKVTIAEGGVDYLSPPLTVTELPASGTALANNTIYAVASTLGTYEFVPPESGWACGTFTTGATVAITFSTDSKFLSGYPLFDPSKQYEFSVENKVWAIAEVVTVT